MKNLVSVLMATILTTGLVACGENQPNNTNAGENKPSEVATSTPKEVEVGKSNYTVDELYQNKELRRKIITECKEKLAQIGNYEKLVQDEPNCGTAQAAEERYSKEFNSDTGKKKQEYKSIFANRDNKEGESK